MGDEISAEIRLHVKEEIEKSKKETKEDVEKASSRSVRILTIVGLVIAILTGVGVYGLATKYIDSAISKGLEEKGIAGLKSTAEELVDKITKYEDQADQALSGISELERTAKQIGYLLPVGSILPFAGGTGDIRKMGKAGWAVCDGTKGTPDLRNRFIRGAEMSDVGKVGGNTEHSHGFTAKTGYEVDGTKSGPEGADNYTGKPNWNHKHSVSGKTETKGHLPPYYNVVFLMKTSRLSTVVTDTGKQ